MTAPDIARVRESGVHPRLEPTRFQTAPIATLVAPASPILVTPPVSWVLRGEFEVEMESEE